MPSITLTTDAAQAARIAHAVGVALQLGRDATGPEVKAYLVQKLKALVISQERKEAEAALNSPADLIVT